MWGNPRLIMWDYGKEINITLEDALLSLESLRFMLGGAIRRPTQQEPVVVRHTEEVVAGKDGKLPLPKDHLTGITLTPKATVGHPIRFINLGPTTGTSATAGVRTQIIADTDEVEMQNNAIVKFKNTAAGITTETPATQGDHVRIFWDEIIENESGTETAIEVTISPNTFPGTYKIVGDTFMRSEKTGKDEPFQFIINKAKVNSEVTITLEAEGDPSTNSNFLGQNSNVEVKTAELREYPESFNYQVITVMYIAA